MNGLDVDLYAWAATRELELLKKTAAAASEGLPVPCEARGGVEDFGSGVAVLLYECLTGATRDDRKPSTRVTMAGDRGPRGCHPSDR